MFGTKLFHLCAVSRAQVFSYYFFCYVAADVLAVVTWLLGFRLLLLGLEDSGTGVGFCICSGGGIIWEDERPLAVVGGSDEFSEDGVVGFLSREPVDGFKQVLIGLLKIELLISHLIIIRLVQLLIFSNSEF